MTDNTIGPYVTNEAGLNFALQQASTETTVGSYTIDITGSIIETGSLEAINLPPGVSLVINGGGQTLDGGHDQRGFFVYSGTVTIEDLTITDTLASGGGGGVGYDAGGGGGGAGLGGGLFVAGTANDGSTAGDVTLIQVTFSDDEAIGGNGGVAALSTGNLGAGGGGGGGLGGTGGQGGSPGGGGGGGVGATASGGNGGGSVVAPSTTPQVFGSGPDSLILYVSSTTPGNSYYIGTSAGVTPSILASEGVQEITIEGTFIGDSVYLGLVDETQGGTIIVDSAVFQGLTIPASPSLIATYSQQISTVIQGGVDSAAGNPGIVVSALPGGAAGMAGGGSSGGGGGGGEGSGGGGGGGVGGVSPVSPVAGSGGFGGGGGGGGGGGAVTGGDGGFGGGGGGSVSVGGGAGGFGGGGGGGDNRGNGGFGAGYGSSLAGGGGLGAGGDIFVQQGGSLVVDDSTLDSGIVAGGTGGEPGSAYGNGIFLQGMESVDLTSVAGKTTTITAVIADEAGSLDTVQKGVAGSVVIGDTTGRYDGVVSLFAADTYTGGTTIDSGTLTIMNPDAAGGGIIQFGPATALVLKLGPGDVPTNQINGFAPGDTIDLQDIGTATGATLEGGDRLELTGGSTDVTLFLSTPQSFGATYTVTSDGVGGTDVGIMFSNSGNSPLYANNEIDLNDAIVAANNETTSGTYIINLSGSIAETNCLEAVDLQPGVTLIINGEGHTLDGEGDQRGLFAYSGSLTLENLTIANTTASGGNGGGGGGGGGAGLGGGLFVAGTNNNGTAPAYVTLNNVVFSNDSARGGEGGNWADSASTCGGGGGGLGGGGGAGTSGGGGGGGLGSLATGGIGDGAQGAAGILTNSSNNALGVGFSNITAVSGGGGGGGLHGEGGSGGGLGVASFSNRNGGSGGFGGGGGGGGLIGGSISDGTGGAGNGRGGKGGFGGGGGGAIGTGGTGGFGGGGGGSLTSQTNAQGGFGAGSASGETGGGGLGAGGDIFVQQGGMLIIAGGLLDGGAVVGGAGGNAGAAFGSGVFVQGTQSLELTASAGTTTTVSDVIADQLGSSGSEGSASVVIGDAAGIGTGTVALDAANTYTGGTTIDAGTLALFNPRAAGSGVIQFGTSTGLVLQIGSGDVPSNTINGFGPGDTIDLLGIDSATGVTLQGGTTLVVTFALGDLALNVSSATDYSIGNFYFWSDGKGGTDIGAVADVGVIPAPPSITGLATGGTNRSAGDTEVDTATPTLVGTGTAGDWITLIDGGTVIAAGTIGADGSWSVTSTSALSNGTYTIAATETNAADIVSLPSNVYQFTVEVLPTIPVIVGVSGVVANDGTVVINVGDPTITGTGPAGDLITILNDGNVLATTTVAADGSWSLQPSVALTSGGYVLEAEATNDSGLVSAPSSPLSLSVQISQTLSLDLPTILIGAATPFLQQIFGSSWTPGDATNVIYESVGGPDLSPPPGVVPALSVDDRNDNQTVTIPGSTQIVSNTADGPVTLVGGGSDQLFLSTSNNTTTFESNGGSGIYLANQAAGGNSTGTSRVYIESSGSGDGGSYLVDTGSGNSVIQAQSGNDSIVVGAGTNSVLLNAGNDCMLDSVEGENNIEALSGNDTISAGPGNNSIYLGSGNDYVISTGMDIISCESLPGGADTINAGIDNDSVEVFANAVDLTFLGGPGSAAIIGGSVSMDVVGWAGEDTVWGSSGGGEYWGGQAGNSYLEAGTGAGACTLAGGNGNNNVLFASNAANDVLVAGGGYETLGGGDATGDNQFFSGPGNTVIVAGQGDDTVSMTEGNTTVWAGANTLTFAYAPGYVVASTGQQTIIGGGPSEVYLFESGLSGGSTFILDFNPSIDQIEFWNYTLDDINARLDSQVNSGNNTMITLEDNTRITFVGLQHISSSSVSVL